MLSIKYVSSVDWGCRIHWLHLCRGVRLPPLNECHGYDTKQTDGEASANECPVYDTKQSDGEVPVMELLWMWNTPLLLLLSGLLWPGVVAPDRVEPNHQLYLCRGDKTPPRMSVLDMTLNNLIVLFQSWSFGECRVPLHCHRSQIHSGLKWKHLTSVT